MPYRPRDIYRGRRKFRVPLTIFLFAIAFLIVGSVGLFYGLQRYVVYEANGVSLRLPFGGQDEDSAASDDEIVLSTPEPTFEPVAVQIVWEDPDFSQIDLGGWEDLEPIQARFVPLDDVINADALATAVSSAQSGGYSALVLEMKDRSGRLAWASAAETAIAYGTAGATDVTETIAALHDAGLTAIAQISCCADNLMGVRNWTVTLQYGGASYLDDDGTYWLDPYNQTIRTYIADLAGELAAMGFDEIVLADLYHPISDSETGFTYSTTLQTPADPVIAVCQMGRRVVNALEDSGVAVSALLDEASLQNGQGALSGQDVDIFWRLFARLYCPVTYGMVSADKELAVDAMNGGDADIRFVPVSALVPEGCESYVITS